VLQVRQTGGLAGPGAHLARLPLVSVYADGRAFSEGPQIAIYPGPAWPNAQVQQLTPDAVRALVAKAVDAGVKSGADLGQPPVADAMTTRFVVRTDAGMQTVDVVGLAEASASASGLTPEQKAARAKLNTLMQELTNLQGAQGAGAAKPYVPTAVAAVAAPFVAPTGAGAVKPPPAKAWPGPALPGEPMGGGAQVGCVAVTDGQVAPVLTAVKDANTLTPWTSGGKQWSLTFRPLLPSESGCADLLAGA
jgi:hypothetical protein